MKEIIVIIRQNKVTKTKEALTRAGIPGFTCLKVMGRGKKILPAELFSILPTDELPMSSMGEYLSESSRLIPKRLFTMMVQDEDVAKTIDAVMEVNSTGNAGDGKIFILPIVDAYRVRDGQLQEGSDSY